MLRPAPTFHERIWGAGRLPAFHGADAPAGSGTPIGESWLLDPASNVTGGPHDGANLAELAAEHGAALVGAVSAAKYGPRLPLLAKFLDAAQSLSVQVHPNDAQALALEPDSGHLGKAEAWYVLETAPGANVLWGFKAPVEPEQVKRAARDGSLPELMNLLAVKPGDVVVNPAGLVHAVGPGTLMFEIQQASDITYRLFDFGRAGPDGRPRELHLEKALLVSDLSASQPPPRPRPAAPGRWGELARLEQFVMEAVALGAGDRLSESTAPASLELLVVTRGAVTVASAGQVEHLARGDALLLPASLGAYGLSGVGELVRCAVVRPQAAD